MPGMTDNCETCEELKKQLRDETFALAKATSDREGFLLKVPWGPEDAKRSEDLRIAEEAAQKRFDEASARLIHHRESSHP